jgi:hypothetical protein
MSEDVSSDIRFCPAVDPPKKSPEERAAEALLGIELAPGGLWSRPLEAAAYWTWLRDRQPDPSAGLDDVLAWLMRFLGLSGRPSEASRFFALGFAQGAELALSHQPLPDGLLEHVSDALLAQGAEAATGLGSLKGPACLSRLRGWVAPWLIGEFMEVPAQAWRLGLSMGHDATGKNPLFCGMLTAEVNASRFEQRFAGRALVAMGSHPEEGLWQAFIRSTYGGQAEAVVLSTSMANSVDRSVKTGGTLRAFLIDARRSGRCFARGTSPWMETLLVETGSEAIAALRRFYREESGAVTPDAPEGPLLESLRRWLFRTHSGLFGANDPGSEHTALRHAYDYLWWRGFLEGNPDQNHRAP